MLEIFLIMALSNVNGRNAENRGRKPGLFRAMTLVLWFGFEIVGMIIGFCILNPKENLYPVYGIALLAAGVGGLISFLWAKNCAKGSYVPITARPLYGAQYLPQPQTVTIVREFCSSGKNISYNVHLNGQFVGVLANNTAITATTQFGQNVLSLQSSANAAMTAPVFFSVYPQAPAEIRFRMMVPVPKRSTGCAFMTRQQVAQMEKYAASQVPPPPGQTPNPF